MLNKILNEQISNGHIFHSYIFEGSKDQTTHEWQEFAIKLLNTNKDINNLIKIISPENNNISIEKIREFNKVVYEEPANFDYNIIVIEDAYFMKAVAQNALLKTLEDMPSYSILIMTTDNKFKLLDTIISRSQTINLKNEYEIDFNSEITSKVIELVDKIFDGNYYIINKEKTLLKELSEYKYQTLFILTNIFLDITKDRYNNVKYNKLMNKISILNILSIERIQKKIEEIKEYLDVNINFQMAMEDLIFTIIEEINKTKEIQ